MLLYVMLPVPYATFHCC